MEPATPVDGIFISRRRHWLGMARRPYPKRGAYGLRKVRVASAVAVGALAALDVTAGAITNAAADKIRFISLIAAWSWSDISAALDDSMEFGVAHSDYSAAEIEEALEAGGSLDLGNKVEQERANRLVRSIGIMSNEGAAQGGAQFNDGKPVKTRLNWLMSAGDTLSMWMRNGSGAVYTTGSTLVCSGALYVRD